jgi:hypothetical protein
MSQRTEYNEPTHSMISAGPVNRCVTDIDNTEVMRAPAMDKESGEDPTPQPGSPMVVITPPSAPLMVSQRPRLLTTPRPRLRRKAATAPPGALQLYSGIKPQPPRRAVSARTARPFQPLLSRYRRTPRMTPPLRTISFFGTSTPRSLCDLGKTTKKSVGKMGLRHRRNIWRAPLQPAKKLQLLSEALSDRAISFSEKTRVKKTLKTKKMEAINTQLVDFRWKDLPESPSSMTITPRELYGPAGNGRGLSPSVAFQPSSRSSPVPASTWRARHFSRPLRRDAPRCESLKHSSAVPYQVANKRTVYIPGPIQLEEETIATPRRGSIATLERFEPGSEREAKRYSDMVALDGVVMFFEGLTMGIPATEKCLDRYWVEERTSRHGTTARRAAPRVPLQPTMLNSVASGSSGLFSPKRALQQQQDWSPASSPSTPGRQKGRLRQLLESSRTR